MRCECRYEYEDRYEYECKYEYEDGNRMPEKCKE